MKEVGTTVILISVLALTLVMTTIFSGIPQVRADKEEKQENNLQVNEEREQINECENNSGNAESTVECNNIVVYGVVCMPGSVCTLEKFDIPFELVTPF